MLAVSEGAEARAVHTQRFFDDFVQVGQLDLCEAGERVAGGYGGGEFLLEAGEDVGVADLKVLVMLELRVVHWHTIS